MRTNAWYHREIYVCPQERGRQPPTAYWECHFKNQIISSYLTISLFQIIALSKRWSTLGCSGRVFLKFCCLGHSPLTCKLGFHKICQEKQHRKATFKAAFKVSKVTKCTEENLLSNPRKAFRNSNVNTMKCPITTNWGNKCKKKSCVTFLMLYSF